MFRTHLWFPISYRLLHGCRVEELLCEGVLVTACVVLSCGAVCVVSVVLMSG